MNYLRPRKAPVAGEAARPLTDSSGDMSRSTKEHQDSQQETRSKKRIPKNIRNDLENALVGLCDVWFEDIKPHLVRNNIKLHVKNEADETEAGGDRGRLPPGAPGCSHLDPASTASGCELCRLLFNAASSIESAITQAASAARQASVSTSSSNNNVSTEVPMMARVQAGRARRRGGSKQAGGAAPRLARTSSTPSPQPVYSHMTMVMERPRLQERMSYEMAEYPKMKNKSTQTDAQFLGRRLPQRSASRKRRETSSSKARRKISKCSRQKCPVQWERVPTQRVFPVSAPSPFVSPLQEQAFRPRKALGPRAPALLVRDLSPVSDHRQYAHYQDDPINRISFGAPYDMDLQILYETPRREENPDNSNLKKECIKERPPWR